MSVLSEFFGGFEPQMIEVDGLRARSMRGGGSARAVEVVERLMQSRPPAPVVDDLRASSQRHEWNRAADNGRSSACDLPLLAERLSKIKTPVCVIPGTSHPIVPPAKGEFLAERLPHAAERVLNASHFVRDDHLQGYVDIVKGWISGGPSEGGQ